MYLTRFRLNAARPGARQLISSPQALHAAVMSSFPNILPTATDRPRVLWRLDRNAAAELQLYVVSGERPDLTHLVEQAGWPAAATAGTRETFSDDRRPVNRRTPLQAAFCRAGALEAAADRYSIAAATPPLRCGTPAIASPISTPASVPISMRSLNAPRCPMRNTLSRSLPSPEPSDML